MNDMFKNLLAMKQLAYQMDMAKKDPTVHYPRFIKLPAINIVIGTTEKLPPGIESEEAWVKQFVYNHTLDQAARILTMDVEKTETEFVFKPTKATEELTDYQIANTTAWPTFDGGKATNTRTTDLVSHILKEAGIDVDKIDEQWRGEADEQE